MTRTPPETVLIEAVANIHAILPSSLIVLLANQLRDMEEERVHGGLDFSVNMTDGRVRSADLTRRSHWRPDAPTGPAAPTSSGDRKA